jgi:hypothetical protein
MTTQRIPPLDPAAIRVTRDALHAYAQVLGGWLKVARPHRKHWWHASLRPSLRGLTTGAVRADTDVEIELDMAASRLCARTPDDETTTELTGQSAAGVAASLDSMLKAVGVDVSFEPPDSVHAGDAFDAYSPAQAARMQQALARVTAALEQFRCAIREETSPIQVWPHHFDLSMIWLPAHTVPGQDPADAEAADKQMNFGFVFGDATIVEPYFYVTAYPLPDALPSVRLPAGTTWRSEGFSGAVLLYRDLAAMDDPDAYLQELWSTLLAAARVYLAHDA